MVSPCFGHNIMISREAEEKEFTEMVKPSFLNFIHKVYDSSLFRQQRSSCERISNLLTRFSEESGCMHFMRKRYIRVNVYQFGERYWTRCQKKNKHGQFVCITCRRRHKPSSKVSTLTDIYKKDPHDKKGEGEGGGNGGKFDFCVC